MSDEKGFSSIYTQGRPLEAIPVSSAMSNQLFAVRPTDVVEVAEK